MGDKFSKGERAKKKGHAINQNSTLVPDKKKCTFPSPERKKIYINFQSQRS